MPNSQDPILRFQGFQSGVGAGGGGRGGCRVEGGDGYTVGGTRAEM